MSRDDDTAFVGGDGDPTMRDRPALSDRRALSDTAVEKLRAEVAREGWVEDTFAGEFALITKAGSGGMGWVYEARDSATGGHVAIKVMAGIPSPPERSRFLAEAHVLERLDHPAIVRYIRHGFTTRGEPYIVMEWLVGESLATRLSRGPLALAETALLGERLADALDYVHRQKVIHRDLKPSNIFLVDGRVDRARLIDFGVAKVDDRDLTQTGQMIGTPGYMAPEQVRGERTVDARADLFALGCVLYECLSGHAPFEGAEVMEVLAKLLLHQPRFDDIGDLPPRLEHLVGSLLAKAPKGRPSDARLVRDELAAVRAALAANDRTALQLRPDSIPAPVNDIATVVDRRQSRTRIWPFALVGLVGAAAAVVALTVGAGGAGSDGAVLGARPHAPAPVGVAAPVVDAQPPPLPCTNDERAGCRERCEAGVAEACYYRGEALRYGRGVAIDLDAAVEAWMRGCHLGERRSCRDGGLVVIRQIETKQRPTTDIALAEQLLVVGCERGLQWACAALGEQLLPGGYAAPDPPRAVQLLVNACDANDSLGCAKLVDVYDTKSIDAALRSRALEKVRGMCRRNVIWLPDCPRLDKPAVKRTAPKPQPRDREETIDPFRKSKCDPFSSGRGCTPY